MRPLTRGFTTNCNHTFCDQCIATHCWRCALVNHRIATCPICREPIKKLQPYAPPDHVDSFRFSQVKRVKFARQEYDVDVRTAAGETVSQRLALLFDIPSERLKLIHKGRVLGSDEEIEACTGHIQLLGTPQSLQMPKGNRVLWFLRHSLGALYINVMFLVFFFKLPALWRTLQGPRIFESARGAWKEMRRVFGIFVASISPDFKPPERRTKLLDPDQARD